MTTTVLLTGFEPFNQQPINPAWEAVRALEGWAEQGIAVHVRQLPCVFGAAADLLRDAIEAIGPDVVIAVGQAGGRADITVERIAINIDDAPIADNRAVQLVDEPIVPGGPAAYFATLPIKAIVHALRAAGLPASVSQTAGTFVCNHVFYQLMHMLREQPVRAGFIHIPFLPQQAARQPVPTASMALVDMVEALKIAVRTACAVAGDLREAGGGTH
ncbi:pyroglutamyl-peptidase I [Massilia sp. YMA4]|uniref:pyroglutamyl-peptidase I n=1 Tax=Massilia sp. YMA4 TaxID=1593482 RepID=UPI000DD16449|nr:pyroglutamyl-peptidase I [Massilia sp. YMA4]AXA92238.1 pyroglutamyl-peptidase I [Massilia sp. YMA4]